MKSLLDKTFKIYNIDAIIGESIVSPVVTAYQINLTVGTRLANVNSVLQDIARDIGVQSVRLVNHKGDLYLEIPNLSQKVIHFRDTIQSKEFISSAKYELLLGIDTFNNISLVNLRKLPHLLVGGSTGSGKSVGIHMIICSLLAKNTPNTLQLLLIDPKKTELTMYNGLPHLISEVITEADNASVGLQWAVDEMERRYQVMQLQDIRDMPDDLPVILIVIDEMADLILSSVDDIETNLIRLAQKARACGIHIIAATQRPSREVVTGLIKANFPARLAYRTASVIDSRVILDMRGAELLLGQGDSLYSNVGQIKRIQAAFIDDEYLLKFIKTLTKLYKRANNVVTFNIIKEKNDTQVIDKKENKNKSQRNKKIDIALWGVFGYTLYKLIKSFFKVLTAPVKGYRPSGGD